MTVLASRYAVAEPPVASEFAPGKRSSEVFDVSGEFDALGKLFVSLDSILQVLGMRQQRAMLPQVRAHVEAHVGKGLTDVRLARIFGLAGGMLEARWLGFAGAVEIQQRTKDGEVRAPSTEELLQRKAEFEFTLRLTKTLDEIPLYELPQGRSWTASGASTGQAPKPAGVELRMAPCTAAPQTSAAAPDSAAAATAPVAAPLAAQTQLPAPPLSASQRLEQLRARIRAKVATNDSVEARACVETRRRMSLCDDAMAMHAVVANLFAKCELGTLSGRSPLLQSRAPSSAGADAAPAAAFESATSEAEAVKVASSQTYAAQAVRPLTAPAARAALAHLALHSDGWFVMEEGVFNKGAKFIRRKPNACSHGAMESLLAERQELKSRLVDLEAALQRGAITSAAEAPALGATVAFAQAPSVTVPPHLATGVVTAHTALIREAPQPAQDDRPLGCAPVKTSAAAPTVLGAVATQRATALEKTCEALQAAQRGRPLSTAVAKRSASFPDIVGVAETWRASAPEDTRESPQAARGGRRAALANAAAATPLGVGAVAADTATVPETTARLGRPQSAGIARTGMAHPLACGATAAQTPVVQETTRWAPHATREGRSRSAALARPAPATVAANAEKRAAATVAEVVMMGPPVPKRAATPAEVELVEPVQPVPEAAFRRRRLRRKTAADGAWCDPGLDA